MQSLPRWCATKRFVCCSSYRINDLIMTNIWIIYHQSQELDFFLENVISSLTNKRIPPSISLFDRTVDDTDYSHLTLPEFYNAAAVESKGKYLLFLTDSVVPDWIGRRKIKTNWIKIMNPSYSRDTPRKCFLRRGRKRVLGRHDIKPLGRSFNCN